MLIWKTLHILSMVTMITVFIGVEIFYAVAIWRRDVDKLAWVHRIVERTGVGFIGIGALIAGLIFGVLTAASGGFDFLAGWLIAAYLLVGLFLVNAVLIGEKVVRVGKQAVKAQEGERPVEEVEREIVTNRGIILVVVNVVLFTAIIVDMTLKPF